jgi:hypothetical protein
MTSVHAKKTSLMISVALSALLTGACAKYGTNTPSQQQPVYTTSGIPGGPIPAGPGATLPPTYNGPIANPPVLTGGGGGPILDPMNYGGAQLDPVTALNGFGQWLPIDGQQYFVPSSNYVNSINGWMPYQHGYWSYDQGKYGWTWISYDPWGWMTAHYGIWRHHRTHGWVWMPFPDRHYEPHCVTWFDQGNYVGWYPYFQGYRGYRTSAAFDDGFWQGPQLIFASPNFGFHVGITLVNRADVAHSNISDLIIRDRSIIANAAWRAHRAEGGHAAHFGRFPGGDRAHAFDFLQSHARERADFGRTMQIKSKGGAMITMAKGSHKAPSSYRNRLVNFDKPAMPARDQAKDKKSPLNPHKLERHRPSASMNNKQAEQNAKQGLHVRSSKH